MRLSFDRLWVVLALALPALIALLVPLPAVDLAYQVRAGDQILAAQAIPSVDTWTFTIAGAPWVDQQWLAQVILAVGYRVGGWELLAVVRGGIIALAFGLLLAACVERGAGVRVAAVLSLVAFLLAAPALALRPQLFGIAIFTALLWLVAVRSRHPRLYWVAPVLVAVWTNVHGSFVLAPLVLGYAWLDDRAAGRPSRTSLLVLVAGTLATLVNPFVVGAWGYALTLGTNPVVRSTASEWQRTSLLTVPGALFYASVLAALAFAWRRSRPSRARWLDIAWLGGWAVMGAWAERGVAWWPLAAAFVVAGIVAAATGRDATRQRPRANTLNAVVAIALAALLLIALPWWRSPDALTGRRGLLTYAPSSLAAALRKEPSTRVFAVQTWASWLEWAAPGHRYFLDSRFELFPPSVFTRYAAVSAGRPDAPKQLTDLGVTLAALPADAPLATGLSAAGWVTLFEDDDSRLLRAP